MQLQQQEAAAATSTTIQMPIPQLPQVQYSVVNPKEGEIFTSSQQQVYSPHFNSSQEENKRGNANPTLHVPLRNI